MRRERGLKIFMITLYHHPRTRSSRFIFLLEELGTPYEIHRIANIRRPDRSGGVDPENPHPHGKSPALKDGDVLVWESTAIALYLTDKFPQNGLGPVVGDPRRGAYVSWLAYYAEVMEFVNATLAKGPYLLGETFSAVDILVGTSFKMFMGSPLLAPTPLLEAYIERIVSRPAVARAQAKENG